MTKKKALQVLIKAGSRDVTGQGCGIRNTGDKWRHEVKEAIEELFEEAYNRSMQDSDKFNLGF